jgi:hypothetical protein
MNKTIFSAALAAVLLAAPSPALIKNAAAQTAAPAAAVPDQKTKKPSASVTALRERQKKCGAEWKEAKAAGKVEKGMTWPKYWSSCNKRLKEAEAKKS